jgi:DNA polymerase-3 subunit beta
MNLSIAKDQLNQGLQAVQNVISSKSTLPILFNVLLRAEGNRLELTGTDLDVRISAWVEANIKTPGAITLPARKLAGIARELSHPEIEISVDDKNTCSLRAGSSFYKIKGLPAEEYPAATPPKETRSVTLKQETFRSMLRKTSFAMSSDESRFVLNGIFVATRDHKVTMVATDGRRLAMAEEEAEVPADSQGEFIIPSKTVNELGRLLSDQGEIEIRFSANQASFTLVGEKGGMVLVFSKLVEGNYPNYRQVIPGEMKERVALPREELVQAVRRAEIMTSDKSNSVKLALSRNNLSITANSPDVGEAKESLAIEYKGVDLAIAFNPGYLIEPLNALTNDEVYLELIDELSPGILKINGPFLYVVMPMRLG